MTDNRTTELREKLTERGVEYTTNDHMGAYETSWNGFTVMQLTPSAKLIMTVTPEQAIAATMGGQRGTVEIAELLDEFEHECYMLRVEASETRARDDVVRESYERILDEFAGRIAAAVGSESNPDGLPAMLTISDDGKLLNWRGENYVKQGALGNGALTAEQVRGVIISADRWEKPMGNTGLTNTHLIIRDNGWQAIADELNATVGNGTCEMDFIETHEYPDGDEDYLCECSNCGRKSWEPAHDLPNFCARCGRAVKR